MKAAREEQGKLRRALVAVCAWLQAIIVDDPSPERYVNKVRSRKEPSYAVRLGNNNAADSYLCDVFRGAVSSAPAAVGKLDSLVRRAAGLLARKI